MNSIFFLPHEKKKIKVLTTVNINDFIKSISKITNSFAIYNNNIFEKIYIFNDKSYAGSIEQIEKKSILIFKNKSDTSQNLFFNFPFKEIENANAEKKKLPEDNDEDTIYEENVYLDKKNNNNIQIMNVLNKIENNEINKKLNEFDAAERYFTEKGKKDCSNKNISAINTNSVYFFRKSIFILKNFLSQNINNLDQYLDNRANKGNMVFILKNFCKSPSEISNVSLMFHFDDSSKHLCIFHFKLIGTIKSYLEHMIKKNLLYKKHYLNIHVKIVKMDSDKIGSTKIKNHVEALDDKFALPKEAILRLNKNKLSNDPKNKSNLDFTMLLFHEILHCYGFGYWNLMGLKNYKENYYENLNNSVYSVDGIFYSVEIMYLYNNILNCNGLIACPLEKISHLSDKNRLILRNSKPYKILPGLNNELMCLNKNQYNCLSLVSAAALESIGYDVDYSLFDKYYIDQLCNVASVNYTKIVSTHFYKDYAKHMLILTTPNNIYTGEYTYSIEIGKSYTFYNKHEWIVYIMSALVDDEKYHCSKNEGVTYFNDRVILTPNEDTPEIIYLVSSITFGGIPLVKKTNDYNEDRTIQSLFKSLLESF